MGWFSKKASDAKTLGSEAGQLARAQVLGEFLLTKFHNDGEFSQPSGFFRDSYVVGFLHGYIVAMADVGSARRRKRWTQKEGNEFVLSAMEAIVGAEHLRDFIGEPLKCKDKQEYKDAYFAANTLIKAIFATSVLTAENPLVSEATKLIGERKDFLIEMFPEPRKGDFLAWAVQEISINRHIRSTYLGE